jgi:hypothetical protein
LLFERWSEGLYEVVASAEFGRVIESSSVLVGISIVAAGGQGIVGKKCAAGELFCNRLLSVAGRTMGYTEVSARKILPRFASDTPEVR